MALVLLHNVKPASKLTVKFQTDTSRLVQVRAESSYMSFNESETSEASENTLSLIKFDQVEKIKNIGQIKIYWSKTWIFPLGAAVTLKYENHHTV